MIRRRHDMISSSPSSRLELKKFYFSCSECGEEVEVDSSYEQGQTLAKPRFTLFQMVMMKKML